MKRDLPRDSGPRSIGNGSAAALLTACALALVAPGCRVGRDYQAPQLDLPELLVADEATAPGGIAPAPGESVDEAALAHWWSALGDPVLDALIERARGDNLDVAIAVERVRQARAELDRARGQSGPALDAQAGYGWREVSTNLRGTPFAPRGPTESFELGFDASWELDLFGRNARGVEAARAAAQGEQERSGAVWVSLLGEIARHYVDLRAAQREAALVRDNLGLQESTLELVRARVSAGLASELDAARAEAQVASTRALLPQYEASARGAMQRLALLTGREPSALVAELSQAAPIPSVPEPRDLGDPAALLERRPDVRAAERDLARATALAAQATAARYPSLALSGSFGVQAQSASNLFDNGSGVFSVAPSLLAPLFHSGALRANERAQEASRAAALLQYRRTVLEALHEVENAHHDALRERERLTALGDARNASQRSVQLARDLFERGLVDFFQVLDSERSALAADSAIAESEAALGRHRIALYKALGGGWPAQESRTDP